MKLGIIIDTDLRIPPFTGVTYRLYYLTKKLVENGMEVCIFLCNRNIKQTKDLDVLRDSSSLEFHVIPDRVFYDTKQMLQIVADSRVDILQFEDAASVLRYQNVYLKLDLPVCLELHDIDMALRESLGHGKREVDEALRATKKAIGLSDAIICMTPCDHKELKKRVRVPSHRQHLVPNPVDVGAFLAFGPNTNSPVVLFMGNMFYWPNLHAAEYIVHDVVDMVMAKNKKVKFLFVGAISKENKCGLKNPHVLFTDRVKNLKPYLKRSTLALCPIMEGSGMKVKILNYCAAAIPVITTTIGAVGYEQIKSLIVEDDLSRYPEIISHLLEDKTALHDIGVMNQSYVKKYYDISKIALKIKKIYWSLCKDRPRSKRFYREKHLPKPLWLDENRTQKIKNDNYYIIQHGKLLSKKNLAAHSDR